MSTTDTGSLRAFRASPAQLRMWFAQRLEPDSPYYNSSMVFRLTGTLDAHALEAALLGVLQRHDMLRTSFAEQDGELLQLVDETPRLPFAIEDAAGPLAGQLAKGRLLQQLLSFAEAPFDLEQGPLLRGLLLRLGPDQALLVLTMHHIVMDGWSMGVLLSELSALYRQALSGVPARLPQLEIQYGDFAEWHRDRDDGAALERWTERLAGSLPALDLPIRGPRSDPPTTSAGGRILWLPADTTAAVRAHARAHSVTSYVTLLAAFSAFLARLGGQSEIVLGTPAACRDLTQTQPLVGLFVNTLPIRIDLGGEPGLDELTRRCRRVVAEAFADEDVPLDRIVEAVRPPRRPGRTPLFDVLFTVQRTSAEELDLPGIAVENIDLDRWWTRYDLEFNVWDTGERMRVMVVYRDTLFGGEDVNALIAQFQRQLAGMLADPRRVATTVPAHEPEAIPEGAALETHLLERLPVRECLVDLDPGQAHLDVVAVPEGAVSEERIATVLAERLPFGVRTRSVTLLSAPMPRLADGGVDREALAAAAPLRHDTLEHWSQAVRARTGGSAARVRVEDRNGRTGYVIAPAPTPPVERTAPAPATAGPAAPPAIADGGPAPEPLATDLVAAIDLAAESPAGVRFVDSHGDTVRTSYRVLREQALRVAAGLRDSGVRPGTAVLLQPDTDHEMVLGLWGAILGGALPVPLGRDRPGGPAAGQVAADAIPGESFLLGTEQLAELRATGPRGFRPATPDPEAPALLLLTSGSTGTPKVVPIRHRSILTRSTAALQVAGLGPGEVSLNWMPLDHVGGIVMSHVRDVIGCCEQVQVDTSYVLADPLRWMLLCHEHQATASWAPNFAFGLVADRAAELPMLDLSRLRYLLDGGEAIVPATARAFLTALEPHGLPGTAVRPAWGMSETCSGQTDSRTFTLANTADGDTFASVGKPYPGFRIRVVDEQGRLRREGEEGQLEVAGDGVTRGYLGVDDAEVFTADGWFRTGDLAVLRDGELTITARVKDVIVVNGSNRPCHELETAAESVPGVSRSFVAATAVRSSGAAADRVAIFYHHPDGAEAAPAVRRAVAAGCGIVADFVVPLAPAEFPKTAIGKIQRPRLRARLEGGELDEPIRAAARILGGAGTVPDLFHRPSWRRIADRPRQRRPTLSGASPLLDRTAEALRAASLPFHRTPRGEHAAPGPLVSEITDLAQAQSLVARLGSAEGTPAEGIALLRGCWTIEAGEDAQAWQRAGVAAFLRSATQETPGLRIRVIELPDSPTDQEIATLAHELTAVRGEPEVAVRGERVLARRLQDAGADRALAAEAERAPAAGSPLRHGGRYLISGGTGGVGRLLAAWLVERYRAEVTLTARTIPGPGVLPLGVETIAADSTNRAQMCAVLAGWSGDAVFHLAGSFAAVPATAPLPADLLAAKVRGAQILDELLAGRPDTELILFSSANGFFGGAGAAGYAAANAALDALAASRAASGRAVRSIAWSSWRGIGGSSDYAGAELSARRGFHAFQPSMALDALEVALRLAEPVLLVGVDPQPAWTGSRIEGECRSRRQLLAEIPGDGPLGEPPATAGLECSWTAVSALADQRTPQPVTGRMHELVVRAWQEALDTDEIRPADGFFDHGGASLQMARLHGILERSLNRRIPLVDLFRHATVPAMSAYLQSEDDPPPGTTAGAVDAARRRASARRGRRGRR